MVCVRICPGCTQALTAKMAEIKNQDMEEEVAQALIQLCVDTMLKVRSSTAGIYIACASAAKDARCCSAVPREPARGRMLTAGCPDLRAQDPVESRMAPLIKREMDKLYSPTWHVFIGKDFGANVTHENKSFISFILGPLSFLVFKSG